MTTSKPRLKGAAYVEYLRNVATHCFEDGVRHARGEVGAKGRPREGGFGGYLDVVADLCFDIGTWHAQGDDDSKVRMFYGRGSLQSHVAETFKYHEGREADDADVLNVLSNIDREIGHRPGSRPVKGKAKCET